MPKKTEHFLSGTKIGDALSPEQLEDFYQRCKKTKAGFTGPAITTIAADFGVTLQHDSANNIRRRLLARRYDELRENAEQSQAIALAAQHGLGLTDSAAVKLAIKINDDLDSDEELTVKDKSAYSLAISRLRTGDQRERFLAVRLREMAQKMELQQFDAARSVLEHAKELRGIIQDKSLDQAQKVERVRAKLFGQAPADFKPIDQKGAQPE